MKKVALLIALGGVFAMSSCKKDWNCDCSVSGIDLTAEILNAKKADAEEVCDAAQTTYQIADSGASCTLSAK